MNAPLAQMITLVGYGNQYLSNDQRHQDLLNHHSFRFCNQVDFIEIEQPAQGQEEETIVANDPNGWFQYLQKTGCRKLRIFYERPSHWPYAKGYQLAGIGGGITWFIEALYERYSNAWESRWQVTDPKSPQKKIWTVKYGQTRKYTSPTDFHFPLTDCKQQLEEALEKIQEFAASKNLQQWAQQFASARKLLMDQQPERSMECGLLVPGENYSIIAKQLLRAADEAWVFGGMGSWNDMGFEAEADGERYNTLSERLYDTINKSIIGAVNSF